MAYLSLVIIGILISLSQTNICFFGTPGKYIGQFITRAGSGNVSSYNSTTGVDKETCQMECRLSETCYAASFDMAYPATCYFYNTTNIYVTSDMSQHFYIWQKCKWEMSTQPDDGRCFGLFVQYLHRSLQVDNKYLVLRNTTCQILTDCLKMCRMHPLCGAVNRGNISCVLHQVWPRAVEQEVSSSDTDLYRWSCVPNFVESISPKKSASQPNVLKCTGYWNVTSRDVRLLDEHSPGVYFHTQSYGSCLSECTERPLCHRALFNVSESMCVLPDTESSDPSKFLRHLTFVEFQWVCLRNDAITPSMNDEEKKMQQMDMRCVRLVDNGDVLVSEDNCGSMAAPKTFVRCGSFNEKQKWTITDLCLVNQSFWKFPTSGSKYRNDGEVLYDVARIFNGLTSFWLAFRHGAVFSEVSFLECRRFNGARSRTVLSQRDIVERKDWFAYTPQGDMNKFTHLPTKIIITASQQPLYGCRTTAACTALLRNLQILYFNGAGTTTKFSDIPYNFMLDESGNIYRVRGWRHWCAAVLDYNPSSLCFGFIGRFKDMYPMIKFLEKMKRLIELAVKGNHVTPNYILYLHQDATLLEVGRNYSIVIKNWYRYRGYIPADCSNITGRTLAVNGLLIVLCSIILSLLWRSARDTKDCKKCEFLHLANFVLIYPREMKVASFGRIQRDENEPVTLNCIVTKKRPLHQPSSDDKFMTILKLWFLNKYLQSWTAVHGDCQFATYLNHYSNYKNKFKVYEAYIKNCRTATEENIRVVFCCSNQDLYLTFDGLIFSKCCVCQYFDIDFLSFSNLQFEHV